MSNNTMVRLFNRNRRRTSVPEVPSTEAVPVDDESIDHGRRYSTPELEAGPHPELLAIDEYAISPTASIPLSETATLKEDRIHRLELQSTYNDNFDNYLPFLLRRIRYNSLNGETPYESIAEATMDNDDQPTILNEPIGDAHTGSEIMGLSTSNYTLKREYIIASEFIKSNYYLFPTEESFNTFRRLRSGNRKHRKSSVTVYDNTGTIKVLRNEKESSKNKESIDGIVDSRNHIIPVTNKMKGVGLPLFKISVPYMSNFKKNAPFVVFHKYKEIPDPPRFNEANDLIEEEFQTFPFCTVQVKKFQEVKRYTFEFQLHANDQDESSKFKVLLFQHCYKPFSDFTYKDTRFRILGTPIISAYALSYNPTLKLLLIDTGKASLCDDLINKKPGFGLTSLVRKNKNRPVPEEIDYSKVDTADYPNPHPSDDNPLLRDEFGNVYGGFAYNNLKNYIPNNLPPFGGFKDAIIYKEKMNIVPKRYSEVGKIEMYQDNRDGRLYPNNINDSRDINSTKSVDTDNLVLNCILLTMREVSIRATTRPASSSIAITNRLGGFRGWNVGGGMVDLAL